jgi:hypothetical protein
MDEGRPISYMSLTVGTPVLSSTGTQFGTVEHVLQIPEEDLFDGIAVTTEQGLRFVDRDEILDITTTLVRCSLSDEDTVTLPPPKGTVVLRPDARNQGSSLGARMSRLFGRQRWKEAE